VEQPRTRLLGREAELACARELLGRQSVGVLTLTGAGGAGKTRLALAPPAELDDTFPDGVYVVLLAGVSDAGQVPGAVAQALGLREAAGQPLTRTLVAFLRQKRSCSCSTTSSTSWMRGAWCRRSCAPAPISSCW
jgi:predicted ATPase